MYIYKDKQKDYEMDFRWALGIFAFGFLLGLFPTLTFFLTLVKSYRDREHESYYRWDQLRNELERRRRRSRREFYRGANEDEDDDDEDNGRRSDIDLLMGED